jgi:hypothetical protein
MAALCVLFAAAAQALPRLRSGEPSELWRLPGLVERVYPAPRSIEAMAASLSRRGFAPNSTYASALNYHSPYNASQAHTAIYVGVGYVSQNYTARLARTTVHLDEFLPLFRTLNATWECANTTAGSNITYSVLSFSPPPRRSANFSRAAHALRFLVARLRAPNATLVWGPALLQLNENTTRSPIWAPSCNGPFAARYSAPYFSVVSASPVGGFGGFNISLTLKPSTALQQFGALKQSWRVDPNITRALELYPNAPVLFTSGEPANLASYGTGRYLALNPDITRTGRSSQLIKRITIANVNWNYGGAPNVARTSPVKIASDVPASVVGCYNC